MYVLKRAEAAENPQTKIVETHPGAALLK